MVQVFIHSPDELMVQEMKSPTMGGILLLIAVAVIILRIIT